MFTAGLKQHRQNTSTNTNQQQRNYDRLVTVESYDVAKGYMYVTDEKGKKYEVFVNKDQVDRSEKSLKEKNVKVADINWMGHAINEKMQKHLPAGTKVILLASKVLSNDKVRNVSVTEVERIVGVPSPEANKTFQGIFTASYRREEGAERISRIQHWDEKGIDINDEEGVNALSARITESTKNYGKKIGEYNITEPTVGIQFRALMKTDKIYELNQLPIYEVVDTSAPFDWIPGPEDEEGKEIRAQAHPLTGEEMIAFAEMYTNYIMENDLFKDHIENMKVEICPFDVYPASKTDTMRLTIGNPDKDKNAFRNPLYQLTHRVSHLDMAHSEEGVIVGRNEAVKGIIQISSDKLAKVDGKAVEIPSFWVQKLHANNTRGHVHAIVRTSEGFKTEPHEKLKLERTDQATNTKDAGTSVNNSQGQSVQQEQSNPSTTQAQPAQQESQAASVNDASDGFDVFSGDFDVFNQTPAAEQAAVEEKAPPAKKLTFGAKK